MTTQKRPVSIFEKNLFLSLSVAFTAIPAVLFSLYLGVEYLLTLITEDAFGYFLEASMWLGMLSLVIAVTWRRMKREKSYPLLLVIVLFTFQSFVSLDIVYALGVVILFSSIYYLSGLYGYTGEKVEGKVVENVEEKRDEG